MSCGYEYARGKCIYLSGAMSGCEDWNKPLFDKWEQIFYRSGANYVHNPAATALIDHDKPHEFYMRRDLFELTRGVYDFVAMLPGWAKSDGAKIEKAVAEACGIELVYVL